MEEQDDLTEATRDSDPIFSSRVALLALLSNGESLDGESLKHLIPVNSSHFMIYGDILLSIKASLQYYEEKEDYYSLYILLQYLFPEDDGGDNSQEFFELISQKTWCNIIHCLKKKNEKIDFIRKVLEKLVNQTIGEEQFSQYIAEDLIYAIVDNYGAKNLLGRGYMGAYFGMYDHSALEKRIIYSSQPLDHIYDFIRSMQQERFSKIQLLFQKVYNPYLETLDEVFEYCEIHTVVSEEDQVRLKNEFSALKESIEQKNQETAKIAYIIFLDSLLAIGKTHKYLSS